jgi:hypothetical protein
VRVGVAGQGAETLRALPRPPQGPPIWSRPAPPGDQEARHQAQEEADQGCQGCLTGAINTSKPRRPISGPLGTPGLNHKLS